MNVTAVAQAVATIATPVGALAGYFSREKRLRNRIRDNYSLLQDLEKNDVLREHTPIPTWLNGKIAIDVARLSGQPLGTPKKPIPKGGLTLAATILIAFTAWTYYIVHNAFVWYSVFPGLVAALMAVSILGMFTDRELPPQANDELPPGAVPIRSDTAEEQIATSVALSASGQLDAKFSPTGQVGVTLRFLRAMQEGRIEDGFSLADRNWRDRRIQAWLWNNRQHFSENPDELQQLSDSLTDHNKPEQIWADFIASEVHSFIQAWHMIDVDTLGAAGRRRRIARDHELIILTPVGDGGGYFAPPRPHSPMQ